MKKYIFILLLVVIFAAGFFIWKNKNGAGSVSTGKEDLIQVRIPKPNQLVKSPLTIKGEAKGNWFFEASFPIRITDENGKELGTAIAQALSDWMTEDFVSFEALIEFQTPETKKGFLILEKDNPSGLPENADELRVPVRF
jgi:hypothetical protein